MYKIDFLINAIWAKECPFSHSVCQLVSYIVIKLVSHFDLIPQHNTSSDIRKLSNS